MSELPTAQKNRLDEWADRAISLGWLNDDAKHLLEAAGHANPGQLFDQTSRPLVAGLFGGTGVGKSTLLNRLAGSDVARASAERPTSRDITVYVHRSVSVDKLAQNLPMKRMRTALHNNDSYRQVMFVDMPDFDSVEESNRELVDLWLPHLDVVLYVVSPERYRDDQGWQLLIRHASEHAWVFVINQWDRGDPEQREDFIRQLKTQGLPDPLVYCTDCAKPSHLPGADTTLASDDFPALQSTLLSLSDDRIVGALQEQGVLARLQKLKHSGDTWLESVGDDPTLTQLKDRWTSACETHHPQISEALSLPIAQLARSQVDEKPFWRRLLGASPVTSSSDSSLLSSLSTSVNERLENVLDSFINQNAHELQLSLPAIKHSLHDAQQQVFAHSEQTLNDSLNQALHSPGSSWQRKLFAVMRFLSLALPLAALGWVSYRVVSGFAAGGSNPGAYLGSSFAVNAGLLLGVSWLIPALLHTWLKPSAQQAAEQGLQKGLDQISEQAHLQGEESLVTMAQQANELRSDYHQLWNDLPQDNTDNLPEPVRRMLMAQIAQSPDRWLDVRANTHKSTDSAPES